jgi:hypothetical protein
LPSSHANLSNVINRPTRHDSIRLNGHRDDKSKRESRRRDAPAKQKGPALSRARQARPFTPRRDPSACFFPRISNREPSTSWF